MYICIKYAWPIHKKQRTRKFQQTINPHNVIQPIEAETNDRHFADDIFKCIFLDENVRISIKISLKFIPKGTINNIPALVQIMAWRRPGDKPLSEPVMVSLLAHIYLASMSELSGDRDTMQSFLHLH